MVSQLSTNIGKDAYIWIEGLVVYVRVLDVKVSYGHTRFKVRPLKGEGVKWVEKVYGMNQ